MAYLHCHNCNWSQDDFWDENYNPITFLENTFKKDLLNENLHDVIEFDRHTGNDFIGWKPYNTKITRRQMILDALKNTSREIEMMVWRTMEEFKKENPDKRCPQCNDQTLDID